MVGVFFKKNRVERGGGIQAGRICVPEVHLGVIPGGLLHGWCWTETEGQVLGNYCNSSNVGKSIKTPMGWEEMRELLFAPDF